MLDFLLGFIIGMSFFSMFSTPSLPEELTVKSPWYKRDYDVTDNIKDHDRSGLVLYVDYGTGVQYLSAPGGGMVPRIDKDGKIINLKP